MAVSNKSVEDELTGRIYQDRRGFHSIQMLAKLFPSPAKQRLLAQLAALLDDESDPELNHITADSALLTYIDDPEVTQAWSKVRKY